MGAFKSVLLIGAALTLAICAEAFQGGAGNKAAAYTAPRGHRAPANSLAEVRPRPRHHPAGAEGQGREPRPAAA